jgi:hypothetical protein
LTKNSPTPGTPERPLSLLGARSYESLWMAMLVRHLIKRLFDQGDKKAPRARGGGKIKKVDTYMRVWERRKAVVQRAIEADDYLNYDGKLMRFQFRFDSRKRERLTDFYVNRFEGYTGGTGTAGRTTSALGYRYSGTTRERV